MAILITREENSADDLRRLARWSKDVAQTRRLLAIALVLEGHSRTAAATAAALDQQSLRDWVQSVQRGRVGGSGGLIPGAVVGPG